MVAALSVPHQAASPRVVDGLAAQRAGPLSLDDLGQVEIRDLKACGPARTDGLARHMGPAAMHPSHILLNWQAFNCLN